jgi:cbb3-type cytochrome oxidase subunit 1
MGKEHQIFSLIDDLIIPVASLYSIVDVSVSQWYYIHNAVTFMHRKYKLKFML